MLFITFLLLLCGSAFSQDTLSRKQLNKARPKYIELGGGLSASKYRDFATAPIFFEAAAGALSTHYHRFDSLRETRFGINYVSGNYQFTIKNEVSRSFVQSIHLDFGKLYRIENLSNDKYSIKAGGMFLLSGNTRRNPSLQNSSFGYELIYNLMASAKVSRDVSRKTTKSGKILFVRYNWKPRKRLLSYQLNVGVVNAHVRNGYAYVDQEQVVNNPGLFADYEHTLFEGFRMNSALRYSIFFDKGHAIRFSYLWDALTTGQEDAAFEMSNHQFNVSILFNI